MFAPHIIMRPADTERWHRPADVGFISLLLSKSTGLEVEKDFIQVDRKKPMSCNIVPPPEASEMDRTVRAYAVWFVRARARSFYCHLYHDAEKLIDRIMSVAVRAPQASAAPWTSELVRSTSGRRPTADAPRSTPTPKKVIDA